jgi:hypothetical protein
VAIEWALANHNSHKERQHKRHNDLSRGSAKYNTFLPPRCGVQWTRVALNPFQVIQRSTWIPRLFLLISFPVCEESPQVGASRPYNKRSQWKHKSKVGSNTHKSAAHTRTQAKTWAQMKHREFTARTELKSLTRSIKCAETECGDLEMLSDFLIVSSMRLGVPFIAPRQLGAVGSQQGRQFLPSVGGAPDSPVHHRTVTVACPVRFSFLIWRSRPLQLWAGWRTGHCPVHTGQSDAPNRPLERATRRPRIAWPTVALAAVGSPDSLVHHRTVRWIIAIRRQSFPRVACSPESSLAHRTLSGAPPHSPVCQTELSLGCSSQVLFFFSFLWF